MLQHQCTANKPDSTLLILYLYLSSTNNPRAELPRSTHPVLYYIYIHVRFSQCFCRVCAVAICFVCAAPSLCVFCVRLLAHTSRRVFPIKLICGLPVRARVCISSQPRLLVPICIVCIVFDFGTLFSLRCGLDKLRVRRNSSELIVSYAHYHIYRLSSSDPDSTVGCCWMWMMRVTNHHHRAAAGTHAQLTYNNCIIIV